MTLKKQAAKVRKAGYKNSGQDSILAHITPEEAMALKARGGSGRTDPHTGLPHFDAGDGSASGDGGGADGGFGLSDGYGGMSFGDSDGFGFNGDGTSGFNPGFLTADNIGYDPASLMSESSSLSSMFGKNGKQAALNALGALGIPGLAPSISAATAPNTASANAAMGQGLLGSIMGTIGSVAGPLGAIGGSFLGNSMGKDFGNVPAMSAEDSATAHAGMAPGVSPGEGYQRGPVQGGFGRANTPGTSDFFNNFLTSMVGGSLTDLGKSMLPGLSGGGNQQPQASYPEGEQANSSKLYSMIVGQDAPQMSTPWSTMQSQSPNMVGSSAGMFSPNGGEYTQPTATAQSFSMPSMGQVGNFVGNNLGNLVTGLYGMYNNRRQQGQIRDQMKGLEGLYSQNSPYAQQLRNTLNARAAATGKRSNVAGREVQLQAALADKASSMAPNLYQMQQGMGTLQNRELMNLLAMGKDTGLFKSLGSLFQSGG